jgi:hypothetical protein
MLAALKGARLELHSPLPGHLMPSSPRVSKPIPRWRADLRHTLEGVPFESSELVGWRSFAFDVDAVFAIDISRRGDEAVLSGVSHGRHVTAMVEALVEAERTVADEYAEVRFLSVPTVFFRGIWLLAEDGDTIIEIPFAYGEWARRSRHDTIRELMMRAQARFEAHPR